MDQVKDWRPFAAIALGIVALFAVFNMGRNMGSSYGYGPGYQGVPQQIILQPAAPPAPPAPGGQVITLPPGVTNYPVEPQSGHRFGGGPGMIIFPLLFGLGLFFLATRFFGGRGRRGWQGGPGNWGGPQGPQGQSQYPPNQQPYSAPQQQGPQAHGQPYQQQNPAYTPQQPPQPYAEGEQGQQTRAIDPRGDITRPEGENY